eukprot:364568-Chlamydomonas_euryale.AAC.8
MPAPVHVLRSTGGIAPPERKCFRSYRRQLNCLTGTHGEPGKTCLRVGACRRAGGGRTCMARAIVANSGLTSTQYSFPPGGSRAAMRTLLYPQYLRVRVRMRT